jgi:acyl carrier protein
MTKRQRVAALLGQVLREQVDPAKELAREQTASWDSLNHLRIVLAFEEEFGLHLEPEVVAGIKCLTDLERLAERAA